MATVTTKTAKTNPKCTCGCGGSTKGGRFIPGHDSKMKSELQKAFRNGGLTADQKRQVTDLGWERFLKPVGKEAERVKVPTLALNVGQVNILRALVKAPLPRRDLAAAAGVSSALTELLGPIVPADAAKVDARTGKRCLVGLKYVTCKMEDRDGKDVYVYGLTAAGRKALDRAEKDLKAIQAASK